MKKCNKLVRIVCLMLALLMAVALCGCAKRAAEDAADTVSNAVSNVKEDADRYGKTEDDTDGHIDDTTTDEQPTVADMDKMVENGVIDDENDDNTDGDNVDDDKNPQNDQDADHDDHADGGDRNAETMGDSNSDFI